MGEWEGMEKILGKGTYDPREGTLGYRARTFSSVSLVGSTGSPRAMIPRP